MDAIVCPKCGTVNPANVMNCMLCRINLQFAIEHPEQLEGVKMERTPNKLNVVSQKHDRKASKLALSSMILGGISLLPSLLMLYIITSPGSKGDWQGWTIYLALCMEGMAPVGLIGVLCGVIAFVTKGIKIPDKHAIMGIIFGLPGTINLFFILSYFIS